MSAAANQGQSTFGTIMYILIGPVLWSAHLAVIYFLQSLLCARGVGEEGTIQAIIGIATALLAAPAVVAMVAPGLVGSGFRALGWSQSDRRFLIAVMRLLAALSLAAIVWSGATALILPVCPALR